LDNPLDYYDPTYNELMAFAYDFAGSGVPPGTYIAVKIRGTMSDTAPDGVYTFSGVPLDCYFRDEFGGLVYIDVSPGYIDVRHDCGDVNQDGRVTVADAVYITSYIYQGGPDPCHATMTAAVKQKRQVIER
jgi:hypothetical protein